MTGRTALKLLLSAALLAWLLSRTPLADIAAALSTLEVPLAAAGLAVSFAAWWLSAVRLWVLAFEFSLADVTRMTFVGLYYGTVLPGQVAGDLVKAYRLSPRQSAPGRAVAATFMDRLVATAALFLAGTLAAPFVGPLAPQFGLVMGIATAALLVAIGLGLRPRARAFVLEPWTRAPHAGLKGLASRFASGLTLVLEHPRRLAGSFALALVFHAACVGIQLLVAKSLGIELPLAAWVVTYAGVSLLLLLPVSIAGLGLREGGYVGLLGLFGVPAAQALSLSFVLFGYGLAGALAGAVIDALDRPSKSAR